MIIRRPIPSEHPAIRALVGSVVTEVYGSLWDTSSTPIGDDDWSRGWIAVEGTEPVGVLLTTDEWIDDLWIVSAQRGHGLGAGHAGFRKVVFSTFLSKGEFLEYAGEDRQSNSGIRVMNFIVGYP